MPDIISYARIGSSGSGNENFFSGTVRSFVVMIRPRTAELQSQLSRTAELQSQLSRTARDRLKMTRAAITI